MKQAERLVPMTDSDQYCGGFSQPKDGLQLLHAHLLPPEELWRDPGGKPGQEPQWFRDCHIIASRLRESSKAACCLQGSIRSQVLSPTLSEMGVYSYLGQSPSGTAAGPPIP